VTPPEDGTPGGGSSAISSLVLRGGVVFDGTGTAPVRADVSISGGRIDSIGDDLVGDVTGFRSRLRDIFQRGARVGPVN